MNELSQAVHNIHVRISTASKNRYDLGHGVLVWYSLGVVTHLFYSNKCLDCLSGKLIDKPIGNMGFYVNIDARFEAEYMRVAEVHLMGSEFKYYLRSVVEDFFNDL